MGIVGIPVGIVLLAIMLGFPVWGFVAYRNLALRVERLEDMVVPKAKKTQAS